VRFSELDGAVIGVWGAGREISSLARQIASRMPSARIAVAVFDTPPDARELAALGDHPERVVGPGDAAAALAVCDVLVRSPGVSIHRAEIRAIRDAGIPVTTATALWLEEAGSEGVLAVTGTKGKSTTASLAAHLARSAGVSVRLAGNVGVPALELLDQAPAQLTVLELSSYQVADLQVGPQVVLLTNLFREHTDWHGSEEAYRADKLRLLGLPGVRSAVVNGREPALLAAARAVSAEVTLYGVAGGWDAGVNGISLRGEPVASADQLPLRGEHNALNLCGALAALEVLGVRPVLPGALGGFQALPHRLQTVSQASGVTWVDDSISTTPESSIAALASFPGRSIVLIAGGQDRGQDFSGLARALADTGARVIGIPSTGPRLIAAARAAGLTGELAVEARDLADAVARARAEARDGSVVLLSPAAPSYDHFENFEERGERFGEMAREQSAA